MSDPAATKETVGALYQILKDFQPTLAALVALTAAAFAYRSAMAKVNYDREVRNEDRMNTKAALLLQLRAASAYWLSHFATKTSADLAFELFAPLIPKSIPEFDDAWRQLPSLPRSSMPYIDSVRACLRNCHEALSMPPPSEVQRQRGERDYRVTIMRCNCGNIAECCEKLRDILDGELEARFQGP